MTEVPKCKICTKPLTEVENKFHNSICDRCLGAVAPGLLRQRENKRRLVEVLPNL